MKGTPTDNNKIVFIGAQDIVELLLQKSADISAKDMVGSFFGLKQFHQ